MKNIKFILITLCITTACILGSCNKMLDVVPENALTYENAFDTPQEMEAMVSTLHSTLNAVLSGTTYQEEVGMLYNGANKEDRSGGQVGVASLANHDWLPPTSSIHHWGGQYALIGYANIIESNMKESYPKDQYNFLLGQAEFAKAYAYYDLARAYGWAPIVPDNDYQAPAVPVSTPDELLKKAADYGKRALEHCPRYQDLYHTDGSKVTDKQYISKEICATLLAYIYAWHASVVEDEKITEADRKKYREESEKYASMVIDGELKGYATLEPSIKALQDNTLNSRYGKEAIFEIKLDPQYIVMPKYALYTAYYTFGHPQKHGISENENPRYSISCKRILDLYGGLQSTDERLELYFPNIREDYDPTQDEVATAIDAKMTVTKVPWGPPSWGIFTTIYEGGFPDVAPNRAQVAKFYKQYLYSDDPQKPKAFVNFDTNKIVWRLADLILLRAEVRNLLGKEAQAIQDLNTIRNRAKAEPYPAATDEGDLQLAIFHERERELIYENHRFWDIRRNKDYYKKFLPYSYRILTDQEIKDGALYYPTLDEAGDYNVLITPNKYWFSKAN